MAKPGGKRVKSQRFNVGSSGDEFFDQRNKLVFSFEYYQLRQGGWCLSELPHHRVYEALSDLRDLNQKTLGELAMNAGDLHYHPIDWTMTSEQDGFGDSPVAGLDAFQVALPRVSNNGPHGSSSCRLIGAIAETTFYVVWVDIHHRLFG